MSDLLSRLKQLQSRFTWDLQETDLDLENLSIRLQDHIGLQLGQRGAAAVSFRSLAYVRYLQDQPEEALSLLNQSEQETVECYGDNERRLIVTYGDLAWLKYQTGDYQQSQSYWQRVQDILAKHPTGSSSSLRPEVFGEKAWTYLKMSRSYYPKAKECFRKALELQADDSEWNAGYAVSLFRTEERLSGTRDDPEQSPAVRQLRRALEITPDDGVLLSMLALKLSSYNLHQEAEDLVERALEAEPDNPHVTRYIGKYLRSQRKTDRAIDLLKRALGRTSQSAFIHHQLAMCYNNKKKSAAQSKPYNRRDVQQWRRESIRHLQEAVGIKPLFDLALADLALMYGEEKDFPRADELFQRSLQRLREVPERSIRQVFHHRYAEYHLHHTQTEAEAVAHYREGLLLMPNTWEWKQCAKKLKQIAERRLAEDDHDSQAYALLACVAQAEGDKRKAAELYDSALDCDGRNGEFLTALCDLWLDLQSACPLPPHGAGHKEPERL